MFSKKKLIKQKAQLAKWLCFIIALGLAFFALLFIPISAQNNEILWFSGLTIIAYFLIHFTLAFRSWISEDDEGKRILCIRDNGSKATSYLPAEYITKIELIEYSRWDQNKTTSAYKNQPYHMIFTQMGYAGTGLIVSYTLPKHIAKETEPRSWQFPAPKAKEFMALLKENNPSIQI